MQQTLMRQIHFCLNTEYLKMADLHKYLYIVLIPNYFNALEFNQWIRVRIELMKDYQNRYPFLMKYTIRS